MVPRVDAKAVTDKCRNDGPSIVLSKQVCVHVAGVVDVVTDFVGTLGSTERVVIRYVFLNRVNAVSVASIRFLVSSTAHMRQQRYSQHATQDFGEGANSAEEEVLDLKAGEVFFEYIGPREGIGVEEISGTQEIEPTAATVMQTVSDVTTFMRSV